MIRRTSVEEILASYTIGRRCQEASTIPAPWYVDPRIAETGKPDRLQQDLAAIGRADQVEKPGQFVTATLAGEPVVAVRGTDGQLRAFTMYVVTTLPKWSRNHAAVPRSSIVHITVELRSGRLFEGMPEFEGVENF